MRMILLGLAALCLSGCLARTALDLATLPVKAAGKTVDVLTTSQDEADLRRGRAARKQAEEEARSQRRIAREERRAAREAERDARRDD